MLEKGRKLRRIVSSLIVALLFSNLYVFASMIQPTRAAPILHNLTITINPDGSITPPTANITTHDNVTYTLTGNIIYGSIVVQRRNIVVDGRGYTVRGAAADVALGSRGVDLSGVSNVTIKNTNIETFFWGISIASSPNSNISGDNIKDNSQYGIFLFSSPNSTISENNITNNGIGAFFYYSSNCTISGNNFANDGLAIDESFQNVVENNLVNGKPLVYFEDVSGRVVSGAGEVVLIKCDSMTVDNLDLSNATVGVQLFQTNNTEISNNNLANNALDGIALYSSNCTVSDNDITNNSLYGVFLYHCSNCTISRNRVTKNDNGIGLYSSSDNALLGNNITDNTQHGIELSTSCSYNTVSENNVTDNGYGVSIDSSENNRFFHNNFNNTQQVGTDSSTNDWDDGYPSGGNYWSDYQTRYPHAVENDSSAVWNTPYFIDSNNMDRYPLMGSFHTFYVDAFTCYVDTISNSTLSDFRWAVNLENLSKMLFFNVTGTSGTLGFCRVAIPARFMSQSGSWCVYVGSTLYTNETIITSVNYTYIYFTYTHSTQAVSIINTPISSPYNLTITSTAGGTTSPALGTYSYAADSTAQISAIPEAGYSFDYWELDGVNVGSANPYSIYMDENHTLKAIFSLIPPPLSASISPPSASITIGQSVTFVPSVSGGYALRSYQWYLNGKPVPEVNVSFTFTPVSTGTYYVYLNVTDITGATAKSNVAQVIVIKPTTPSVGGVSAAVNGFSFLAPWVGIVSLLAAAVLLKGFIVRRRKRLLA